MKAWLLALSLLCPSVWAYDIHTLRLEHRLAAELLPQIDAFLPEDATISAYDNMLIIKADDATLTQIQTLLEKLDQPLKSLVVTVLRTDKDMRSKQGIRTQAEIEIDDGLSGSANVRTWSTQDARNQDQQYQARAIEGRPVTINMGEDIPQQRYLLFADPHGGVGIASQTDYISLQNGFRAVPYVLPQDRVRVEIQPFFSKLSGSDNRIESGQVLTTVEGKLGEWLELGQITDNAESAATGFTTYRNQSSTHQYIYLKIDPTSN